MKAIFNKIRKGFSVNISNNKIHVWISFGADTCYIPRINVYKLR